MVNQVEGLFQLYGPRTVMPLSGGWAMDATNLVAALDIIERQCPRVVVELGSGTSSAWIGRLVRRLGTGRVISLDHEARYADGTRAVIERLGLTDCVEVRVASMVDAGIAEHETPWYDISVLDDVTAIDVMIIDGPPDMTGPMARYPALPMLVDRMSDGALILVDDAGRSSETEMIDRWKQEYPVLTEEVVVPSSALRALRLRET